jgi:hypothetical protein
MAKKKTNVATATESTAAFSPQHVKLIKDRLGKIEGDIYLVASMAALIAPDSEEDIEMHTVLGHMEGLLLSAASALSDALAAERAHEVGVAS